MQKIRERVLLRRDKVYEDNEGEVRKRWNFEDAVSFCWFIYFNFYFKQFYFGKLLRYLRYNL